MGRSYVIITPAKNEEIYLPFLAESMLKQTIQPTAWFIIDDGSDDGTPRIIDDLASKHPWIHGKRLEKGQTANIQEQDNHFVRLIKEAFDYVVDYYAGEGIEYEYIGQVDADMLLPPDYFEKVIEGFEQNPKLGIAGGHYTFVKLGEKGNIIQRKTPPCIADDNPSGGCMLIKRACFQDIGGIPIAPGQDGATLAKARLCGWKTRRLIDIEMFHLRERGSARWEGYIVYCLDAHPLLVLLNCLDSFFVKRAPLRALGYLYGYSLSFLKREQKVTDPSLRYYFRHKRLGEVRKIISLKMKSKFNNLKPRK